VIFFDGVGFVNNSAWGCGAWGGGALTAANTGILRDLALHQGFCFCGGEGTAAPNGFIMTFDPDN
jgi:hypothetical protein